MASGSTLIWRPRHARRWARSRADQFLDTRAIMGCLHPGCFGWVLRGYPGSIHRCPDRATTGNAMEHMSFEEHCEVTVNKGGRTVGDRVDPSTVRRRRDAHRERYGAQRPSHRPIGGQDVDDHAVRHRPQRDLASRTVGFQRDGLPTQFDRSSGLGVRKANQRADHQRGGAGVPPVPHDGAGANPWVTDVQPVRNPVEVPAGGRGVSEHDRQLRFDLGMGSSSPSIR
jgi:hypothetical protein